MSSSPRDVPRDAVVEEDPGDVGLGGHLGEHEPVVLELADRLAERRRGPWRSPGVISRIASQAAAADAAIDSRSWARFVIR